MFPVDKELPSNQKLTLPHIQKRTHPYLVRNINTHQSAYQVSI